MKMHYLNQYQMPHFLIDRIYLTIDLQDHHTKVTASYHMRRHPDVADKNAPLVLMGEDLQLIKIAVDDTELTPDAYQVAANALTIFEVPDQFKLHQEVVINPLGNTQLSGLYKSDGFFCTQCESEGFRRIVYALDRPDVLSIYEVTLIADRIQHPILLSNGHCIDQGDDGADRHWTKWVDPHPKPCYLFACVAGAFDHIESEFVTKDKRKVRCVVYVPVGKASAAQHALDSLKKAMAWDESVYGLAYDLDNYFIVAINDFNAGAMENKGLNIFNSQCILATPETATDQRYAYIENVIGHEYFHNWSGNRVTVRDWFQISLKEGLTIFRDQSFSSDMQDELLQRINHVNAIRNSQFKEDSSPMAHPVQPKQYQAVSNFYTATVYYKGGEVLRMLHTLLGKAVFFQVMERYFRIYDGQAVTIEDLLSCVAALSDLDIAQFRRWYDQAGTPEVAVKTSYDSGKKTLTLTLSQSVRRGSDDTGDAPWLIPIRLACFSQDGSILKLETDLSNQAIKSLAGNEWLLTFSQSKQDFVFYSVIQEPILSIGRGFTAPVKFKFEQSIDALLLLSQYDSDLFSRWDAHQTLILQLIDGLARDHKAGVQLVCSEAWLALMQAVLMDKQLNGGVKAQLLSMPTLSYCLEVMPHHLLDDLVVALDFLKDTLAQSIEAQAQTIYVQLSKAHAQPYDFNKKQSQDRAIKHWCLYNLCRNKHVDAAVYCQQLYQNSDNLTDQLAAIRGAQLLGREISQPLIDHFYIRAKKDSLLLDQWFAIQASDRTDPALERIEALLNHTSFNRQNPNRVRAVLGTLTHHNLEAFHCASGAGYRLLAREVMTLDAINRQIAANLAHALINYNQLDKARKTILLHQLASISKQDNLSTAVSEVVQRGLSQDKR